MKPYIDETRFGSITIDGEPYDHDVLIRLDGAVKKRKKKLSSEVYGTSHTLSLAEAEYVCEPGAEWLIVGTGQSGMVALSDEAARYFTFQRIRIKLLPTPQAIEAWNHATGKGIGLFHITC